MNTEESITKIKEKIVKEKKAIAEINHLNNSLSKAQEKERPIIEDQINKLKDSIKEMNTQMASDLDNSIFNSPLNITTNAISQSNSTKPILKQQTELPKKKFFERRRISRIEHQGKVTDLEKDVIKRLKKVDAKKEEKKEEKPNAYFEFANKLFGNTAKNLIKKKKFVNVTEDLIRSNLEYTSITYVSIFFLNTIIAFIAALAIFSFFLFFKISSELPILSLASGNLFSRFLKVFWILIVIPGATFLFMRLFPSLERKSIESKIDAELPFAAIHMAAISGSMINPINVFKIVASTKEYPHLEKEFNKLLNEINIYGYDLVSALKDIAKDCPSQKLSELFNGLATTITSGGNMYEFFDKRSQTLLFDYKLDKEKSTKAAESFMDMYISMVVAAPMVLMLLLMMMKLSGLGIALSTSLITLLVVGGVSAINVFFLIFLQLKQPNN